jgi:hypothetical protein
MRRLSIAVAALVLAGCTATTPGSATPSAATPIPPVNVRPTVAPPPGETTFPDFNALAPADLAEYRGTNWHHDDYVTFRTDDGTSCFAYVYGGQALGDISCDSNHLPGFPADAGGQELRHLEPPGTTFAESVLRPSGNGPFEFRISIDHVDDSPRILPVGHRLVVGNTGCGVAADGVLACLDVGGHGFVVARQGSWAF